MAKEPKSKPPEVRKGFVRVEGQQAAFWSPNDEDAGHPNPLVAIYLGARTLKARAGFEAQDVIDCEEVGTGTEYTVAVKGNLPSKVRAAKLGVGETFLVQWMGKVKPSKEMPHGMNDYDLQKEVV